MATETDETAGHAEPAPEPTPEKPARSSSAQFFRELPVLVIAAFVLALVIKTFLVQAFYIPSASMEPTLMPGDRVLVNRVVYHVGDIHRGDIIVFNNPNPGTQPHRNAVQAFFHWLTEGIALSRSPEEDFIKRVIGLPGDTVSGQGGRVYVNGRKLDEPYLPPGTTTQMDRTWHVPKGELFVMGDNRSNSLDSRFGLGFIPLDKVVGEAFVIMWPPSRFALLH